MRYVATICMLMLWMSTSFADDASARARAALSLTSASDTVTKAKTLPCGKKMCDCGCTDGDNCRCAVSKPTITSDDTQYVSCPGGVCSTPPVSNYQPSYSYSTPTTYYYYQPMQQAPRYYYTPPVYQQYQQPTYYYTPTYQQHTYYQPTYSPATSGCANGSCGVPQTRYRRR